MKINEEIITKATEWTIKELYHYMKAINIENPDIDNIMTKIKYGVNIKLNINYFIQPQMQKYLQNKGNKIFLYKKPLTTLEELYEEMDTRKAILLNTLINLQQKPSLIGR